MKLNLIDKIMLGVLVVIAGIVLWTAVYMDTTYHTPSWHIPHTKVIK